MAGGLPFGGDVPFIDLNPYLGGIFLILDLLEWLGVIPDPLDELLSLFTGRPRDQATSQVVQYLGTQKNAAARLYGVALGRLLADDNIVLSSSSAGDQKLLSQAYRNFVGSLQAQGQTLAQARTTADVAIGPAGQAGTANQPILKAQAPSNFTITGPASIAELYAKELAAGEALGYSGTQLNTYALRLTLKNASITDLLNTQIAPTPPLSYPMSNPPPNWPQSDPTGTTTNPPPSTTTCKPGYVLGPDGLTCWLEEVIPNSQGGCPGNYVLDSAIGLCVYTPPPNTTQPPGNGGNGGSGSGNPPTTIPPPPTSTGPGDELTDCCNATATYLYYIATAIEQLTANNGASGGSQSNCCAQITAALTNIATGIAAIPAAIPAPAPATPVDLSGILTILTSIQTSLAQIDADNNANAATLATAIGNVGKAIAEAPPTDVSGIVQQLTNLVTQGDVPQGVLDYLLSQGYMSSSDAQIIQGAPWAETIVTIFRTWGWNALTWVASWVGITYTGSTWSLNGLGTGIANLIADAVSTALTAGAAPLLPELTGLIDGVASILQPAGAVSFGNIGVNPDLVLAKTLAPALILNAVALVGSYLGWEISGPLEKYVDWASSLTGLEELKDIFVGALYRNGVIKVTDMNAKALYRQDAPDIGTLMRWASRGYIATSRAAALAPLFGLPAEFVSPMQEAAYTNLPERFMVQIFDSPTFSQADLQRILVEHGLNSADSAVMLNAFPYIATKAQRSQLQSAYEAAYVAGLLSDTALIQALETVQSTTDYQTLILTRCQVELALKMAQELEASYTKLANAATIDLATYASNLEGIGLQPNKVNTLLAVAENQLTLTAFRQAAAAEKALARATTNVERKAALKGYAAGQLDTAALAVALAATGLSAVQAAAWTDLAVLQQGGNLRLVFGLLLAPKDAALLRQRVSALTDQRKKALITDAQYTSQLQNLNIPQNWINALLAAAAANIDVTGTPAFVNVSTS